MAQIDDFFMYENRVEGITDADYQRAQPYVEAAQAFAQTTYQSIYIIDYYRKNFLYVSDNPLFLQCMMSYDFHITHGERLRVGDQRSGIRLLLVNHKITPLAMTTEGRVWLALCTVSLSPHKEAGHIEFFQFHTGEKREYSLEAHRWKSRETITLKPEEKQILTLSAQGYTMKEIAEKMLRSFDTVKFYRRQIFEKLDVQNITEALALATNYGLV